MRMEAIAIKQYEITYAGEAAFRNQVRALAALHGSAPTALFQIFCDYDPGDELDIICGVIRESFPEGLFAGTSSYGAIVDGEFASGGIVVTAAFFELASSKVEVISYPLSHGAAADVARDFVGEVAARPWVAAVEVLLMNNGESVDDFCEVMSAMREDVVVFGGESHYGDPIGAPRFIIGGDGKIMPWGVTFVLFGGEDLHFLMRYVQGWKALGAELSATSYEGALLHELDGEPAYDVYNRYLRIENDERFMANALDFPFLFRVDDDTDIVRVPLKCTPDGSIALTSTVPPSARLHIGCGDPDEIIETVAACGRIMADFRPDALLAFSCVARRMFWSDAGSSRETRSFQSLAPTSGFYTAGELLRVNGRLLEHSSTLVMAAAREGAAGDKPPVLFAMPAERRKKSLVSRFAFFIDAAMSELREANLRLEVLSKTDELTGLANRRQIESLIRSACECEAGVMPSLVMMDLDDFKQINDKYGHRVGDEALRSFAHLAKRVCEEASEGVSMGRWGGEEFIVLMRDTSKEDAAAFAEYLRGAFEAQVWDRDIRHTVSMGVTRVRAGEGADAALSRVDEAMYRAKRGGKNCVIALD